MKMKLQKIKHFLMGFIASALVFTLIIPATAAMIQKQISVFTGVNLYVDDIRLYPEDANGNPVEAFIYNGTTYLPARAMSEAVGKAISWDDATKTVYMGKHDTAIPAKMLYEMEYLGAAGGSGFFVEDKAKDNFGNWYDNGIYASSTSDSWEEYNLNGMYRRLLGKVVLQYENRSTHSECYVQIFADGKLVYHTPVMTSGSEAAWFDLDLTGVARLKVLMHNGSEIYIVDAKLFQ